MRELAANFGINRLTAQRAIELLAHDGYVRVYRRIGVFVERQQDSADMSTNHLGTFTSLREDNAATRTLSVDTIFADEALAERLQIEIEEKVVKVEQVRLSEGIPVALGASWLPYSFCSDVLNANMECEPLDAIAQRTQDVNLWRSDKIVQAALATDRELSLLDLQAPAALLSVHRTTYDTSGKVVEYAQIVYPKDRYHIEMPPQQWQ